MSATMEPSTATDPAPSAAFTESSNSATSTIASTSKLSEGFRNFQERFQKSAETISSSLERTAEATRDAAKKTGQTIATNWNAHKHSNIQQTAVDEERDATHKTEIEDDELPPLSAEAPQMPPDETLQQHMTVILKKRLSGLSVKQFYDSIWEQPSFYHQWLEASGKKNIQIEEWQSAETSEEGWLSDWTEDTTTYTSKRVVTFQFTRTTHLYTGPPVAEVKQTHWLSMSKDRCMVHIQVEMDGIPFASSFNVQIRWVVTNRGGNMIGIQVGLHVNFVQQTLLASKIRSGTTEETTKAQRSLLKAALEECAKLAPNGRESIAGPMMVVVDAEEDETSDDSSNESDDSKHNCFGLSEAFAIFFPNQPRELDPTTVKALALQKRLGKIVEKMKKAQGVDDGNDQEIKAKLDSELTDIQESLVTIEQLLKMSKDHASKRTSLCNV